MCISAKEGWNQESLKEKYKLIIKRRAVVYHDEVKDEGYFKGHREREKV